MVLCTALLPNDIYLPTQLLVVLELCPGQSSNYNITKGDLTSK